jgi:glycosyltransferase involved in cell wall biosynthesis
VRVLVVAAYVSADGSYGGPVSVALDHAAALTAAGHDVTVATGWDGADVPGHAADLRLFRARKPLASSFAGLVAPRLPGWVWRHAPRFDVVHVHLTRDLVTLPAAWLAVRRGVPVVLQTHGQIRPERSRGQAALDALLTRRVFRSARAFLTLTPREEADLRALGVDEGRLHRIDNGVPPAAARAKPPGEAPLVLYSSRLAERKRPRAFVEAAALVAAARPDARFELWGPDGGELAATLAEIERRGLADRCRYRGATTPQRARAHLADAAVFVLPSVAEPFPMALLEAFSAGLPSVITDRTGLSDVARTTGAAVVTDGSPAELAAAVLRLLGDGPGWHDTAAAAVTLAESRFGLPRIADRLEEVYRSAAHAGG